MMPHGARLNVRNSPAADSPSRSVTGTLLPLAMKNYTGVGVTARPCTMTTHGSMGEPGKTI